jgi:hypothetical protein
MWELLLSRHWLACSLLFIPLPLWGSMPGLVHGNTLQLCVLRAAGPCLPGTAACMSGPAAALHTARAGLVGRGSAHSPWLPAWPLLPHLPTPDASLNACPPPCLPACLPWLLCSFTSLWFLSTTTPTTYSLVGSLNKVPTAVLGLVAFHTPWNAQVRRERQPGS